MIWYCPDCTEEKNAIKYAYREIQKARANKQVVPTSIILGCSCKCSDFPDWKKKLWEGRRKFGKRIRNRGKKVPKWRDSAHPPEKHNGVGVL